MEKLINTYATNETQLTEEILTIISDEIVGEFEREKNEIRIKLTNGQKFIIEIKEEK